MDTAIELLSQFTGTGGGQKHAVVNFGVAAIFWALLLRMTHARPDREHDRLNRPLFVGFAFCLAREVVMLTVKILEAYAIFDTEQLHLVFPPLEHALSNVGLALIAGVYAATWSADHDLWMRFSRRSVGLLGVIYLATSTWWAWFSWNNPDIRFGQTWTDWAFRIATSGILAICLVAVLRAPQRRTKISVVLALTFLFLNEFLKIIDMAYGEQYEASFAVVRHTLYLLALPLITQAYIISQSSELSTLLHDLEDRVEERTRELADTMADLELTNESLLVENKTDPLTRVGNRAAHDEHLRVAWEHAIRTESDLSALVIDMNKFKQLNDEHGHEAGDKALVLVAAVISDITDPHNDHVARVGGDEFLVLLSHANRARAARIANSIRDAIADLSVQCPGLSVSVGRATVSPMPDDDAADVIRRADEAMYKEKRFVPPTSAAA